MSCHADSETTANAVPLNRFLELTGRLMLSPAEYGEAQEAGWDDVPPQVLRQIIERVISERNQQTMQGKRLGWIKHDVNDAIAAWRRAVGPY